MVILLNLHPERYTSTSVWTRRNILIFLLCRRRWNHWRKRLEDRELCYSLCAKRPNGLTSMDCEKESPFFNFSLIGCEMCITTSQFWWWVFKLWQFKNGICSNGILPAPYTSPPVGMDKQIYYCCQLNLVSLLVVMCGLYSISNSIRYKCKFTTWHTISYPWCNVSNYVSYIYYCYSLVTWVRYTWAEIYGIHFRDIIQILFWAKV